MQSASSAPHGEAGYRCHGDQGEKQMLRAHMRMRVRCKLRSLVSTGNCGNRHRERSAEDV